MKKEPWFQTCMGNAVNPFNMEITDIRIEEIAHALSLINRFGGHTNRPYSVARHCFILAQYVWSLEPDEQNKLLITGSGRLLRQGHISFGTIAELSQTLLLHDAFEAYAGDVLEPFKNMYYDYIKAESAFNSMLVKKYSLPVYAWHEDLMCWDGLIDMLDRRITLNERNELMTSSPREKNDGWPDYLEPINIWGQSWTHNYPNDGFASLKWEDDERNFMDRFKKNQAVMEYERKDHG